MLPGEYRLQLDRLAEIYPDFAEMVAERFDRSNEPAQRFLLLGGPTEFADEGIPLDQLFVAEVNWNKHDRTLWIRHVGVNGHRQHAALRLQQPTRAAAPAFDEILHGVPLTEHLLDVGIENRGIQAIAFERTAQEESAATTQNPADNWKIQVDARRDVGQLQPLLVGHVSEQQVVDMTTMARGVDYLFVVSHLVQLVGMVQFAAVVNPVPKPPQ